MKQNLIFRQICQRALGFAGTLAVCSCLQVSAEETAGVKIHLDAKSVIGRISPDFMGLGYESSAVAQSNFFCADNTRMVQLYRTLSPHGLIRIGGNVSDHTKYEPDGVSAVRSEKDVTII